MAHNGSQLLADLLPQTDGELEDALLRTGVLNSVFGSWLDGASESDFDSRSAAALSALAPASLNPSSWLMVATYESTARQLEAETRHFG